VSTSTTPPGSAPAAEAPPWFRNALRALAVAMGALHTAVAVLQQSMNEDGISYLDLGDAYWRGDFDAIVNGIWSPAYAWIIASTVRLVEPPIAWEFPVVQLANLGVYVVALVCFEFFWRRLTLRYYADGGSAGPWQAADGGAGRATRFPPAVWLALGYSLFIWSSLDLVNLWAVTPDMGVAAVVYLVAGFLLGASACAASARTMFPFGLLLGFGYLVKAALLPLGIVAAAFAALVMTGPVRRRVAAFGAALAGIAVVGGPLIVALSWSSGQLTIGDVGRFAYLKHVNEMPYADYHGALDRLAGRPVNPPRLIHEDPRVFEFAEPVGGTYPMAYDPGYWTRGLEPTVTVSGQLRALATSAMAYFDLFVRRQGGFVALVLLLFWMRRREEQRPEPSGETAILLWALAAFGMYALVHVLPRYVAPFVVLFWAGALARLAFPAGAMGARLATLGGVLLTVFVWINLAALHLDGVSRVTGFTPVAEASTERGAEAVAEPRPDHVAIAADLERLGLREGERIGFIGYSYNQYWARLARLRIVAEIHLHETQRFWTATPERQAEVLAAFARAGAVAVVSAPVPQQARPPGWQSLGDSQYLIYGLR
jgi:hypothetical protein